MTWSKVGFSIRRITGRQRSTVAEQRAPVTLIKGEGTPGEGQRPAPTASGVPPLSLLWFSPLGLRILLGNHRDRATHSFSPATRWEHVHQASNEPLDPALVYRLSICSTHLPFPLEKLARVLPDSPWTAATLLTWTWRGAKFWAEQTYTISEFSQQLYEGGSIMTPVLFETGSQTLGSS